MLKAIAGVLVVVSDVNQHAAPLRGALRLKPALFVQLIHGMELQPTSHLVSATHSHPTSYTGHGATAHNTPCFCVQPVG